MIKSANENLQHCTDAFQQISNKRSKPALLRGVKN